MWQIGDRETLTSGQQVFPHVPLKVSIQLRQTCRQPELLLKGSVALPLHVTSVKLLLRLKLLLIVIKSETLQVTLERE